MHGHRAWKNDVLGEATLRPIEHPPSWSPSWCVDGEEKEEEELAFDWEGEVKAHEGVKIPSFMSGDLRVKVRPFLIFLLKAFVDGLMIFRTSSQLTSALRSQNLQSSPHYSTPTQSDSSQTHTATLTATRSKTETYSDPP